MRVLGFVGGAAGAFVFAFYGGEDCVDAIAEALVVVALFEVRGDLSVDDVFGGGVGDHAFEAVADLEEHFAVVGEDEEDGAVVLAFHADVPGLGDADCVIGDVGVGLHFGVDDDADLVGGVAFDLFELAVEVVGGLGGGDVGLVVELGCGGRGDGFGGAGELG